MTSYSFMPRLWEVQTYVTLEIIINGTDAQGSIIVELTATNLELRKRLETSPLAIRPKYPGPLLYVSEDYPNSSSTALAIFGNADEALLHYLERNFSGMQYGDYAPELYQSLKDEARIPMFGSPPEGWSSLGDAINRLGSGSVAAVLAEANYGPRAALLAFVGITIFVRIVDPVTEAFGRGLASRIDRFLAPPSSEDVPPEDTGSK